MFSEILKCIKFGMITATIVSGFVLYSIFDDLGESLISFTHYMNWFIGAVIVLTPTAIVLQHIVPPKDYLSWSNTCGGALGLVLYAHWSLLYLWGPTPYGMGDILNIDGFFFPLTRQMLQWQIIFLAAAFLARRAVCALWKVSSS